MLHLGVDLCAGISGANNIPLGHMTSVSSGGEHHFNMSLVSDQSALLSNVFFISTLSFTFYFECHSA